MTEINDAVSSSGTEELFHTNLLRLQASQLLSESILPLSSSTGMLENEVKWSKDVWSYLDNVKKALGSMNEAVLSPDDVVLQTNNKKEKKTRRYWIQLHSDKARRHINELQKWEFPFPGGEYLKMAPIHSYAANGAGLTTPAANANVVPTLDLAVLLPVKSKFEEDEENEIGMVGDKDYMNGRYFDKRNIFAIHVSKFLAQKKQRKTIGSVHVVNELDGDYRKVALVLTPPLDSSDSKGSNKKRKNDQAPKKKKAKLRFRVRLVFGAQFDGVRNTPDTNTGWIPCARLFPDRCNNKVPQNAGQETTKDSTPTYNNSLVTDLHYMTSTQILASVSSLALKVFSEAWALLKIWCLQRGFLRGHDTFSETTLGLSLAYLYRSKRVSPRMDSIQVVTVWMKFMSDMDWLGDKNDAKSKVSDVNKDTIRHSGSLGYQDLNISSTKGKANRGDVVMPEEGVTEKQTIVNCIQNRLYASDYDQSIRSGVIESEKPKSLLECFKTNTDAPVFLDPSMTVNYFGNLSPSFIREVQHETSKALDCIHFHRDQQNAEGSAHRIDPFRQLFLEHARFWRRYDAYLTLDLDKLIVPNDSNDKRQRKFWGLDAQDVGNYESIVRGIIKVLKMGLGDRVTALRVLTSGNGEPGDAKILSQQTGDIGTNVVVESDEIKMVPIRHTAESSFAGYATDSLMSPVSSGCRDLSCLVIGVRINSKTCHRIVDRGPPANESDTSADFVALWGEEKAQLRRFKDGAIVHAVVWNERDENISNCNFPFESGQKFGDTVERIIRHIVGVHFAKTEVDVSSDVAFSLRNLASMIDGGSQEMHTGNTKLVNSAEAAQKSIVAAFDKLSLFLKEGSEMVSVGLNKTASKLGLPLSVDRVEALSPSLRYSSTFPQVPHPLLGSLTKYQKKVAGAVVNDPILIQMVFEGSSKWPTDTNAMGAAKCAMLMQIADGIENMKGKNEPGASLFDGPMNVTPSHIEFGFSGYVWRLIIRADQELKILSALQNPSREAITLRRLLIKRHITASRHHFTIHGVNTKYAAAGPVIRLLRRWIASHMLSGLIPTEAIELLVASVFTDPAPFESPTTVSCGFLRCLDLLSKHDWARSPLIVDPEGHISGEERADILSQFEAVRGSDFQHGAPMYIISPNDYDDDDSKWAPSYTQLLPERVVLGRLCALAKRSSQFLINCLVRIATGQKIKASSWASIFHETPASLKSYSALFRIDPQIIVDSSCSSTSSDFTLGTNDGAIVTPYRRSMEKIIAGPKILRKKVYKNLNPAESDVMYGWTPIDEIVQKLRSQFGRYAVFFYNEFCPDLIAMLWRPHAFERQTYSAMHSEFFTPVEYDWIEDGLVTTNSNDVLRAAQCMLHNVVVDTKVLDDRTIVEKAHKSATKNSKRSKKKAKIEVDVSTSSSDDDESDD